MNDKPEDSGQALGVQDANPVVSQKQGVQPNSNGGGLTAEQYRQIAREEATKVAQSTKDRRFDGIEREQQNQRSLLERVEAKLVANPDMTFAQAKRDAQLDALLEPAPAAPVSTGSRNDVPDVSEQIIESLGFDANDEEVSQIRARTSGNLSLLGDELKELIVSRATAPKPNAAVNAAPTSGVSVSQKPVDQLTAEYIQKMAEARGNKTLAQNMKESYRNQGVPVDSVILSV